MKKKPLLSALLRSYRGRIFGITLLMILQAVLQVGLALLMRFVIDAAISGSDRLGFWAALLIADLLLQVLLHCVLSWQMGSVTDRMIAELRGKLLKSALYSRDARLRQFHSGQLLSRGMEDVRTVCDGVVNALPGLAGQISRLVAAFAALVMLSPKVALVLAAAAVVVVGGISVMRPALKKKQRSVRTAEEKVMSTMQEDLQKLELVQSLQSREPILERFDGVLDDSLEAKKKRRVLAVGSGAAVNMASLLGTGALLLWGAGQVADQALTYGALTSMLQLLSQFRTPVLSISGLWTRFTSVEVAGERLVSLLETDVPETAPAPDAPTAVVFENVTFRYPDDENPVLENFSLRLPLEGWAWLGGISGRGKTTLFKLILGLYTPQSGSVYLETAQGAVPCSECTRQLFAYVPQDYALFSGTVEENLRLVAPDAAEQQLRDALEVACCDFLSEGLDTLVGENNTGLSKGQLQRIAIARCVLMGRKVLLLDECTSALDMQTEAQVLENLKNHCPNALLVTHRLQVLEGLGAVTQIAM